MNLTPISFKNNLKLTLRGFVHEPKKYDTAILFLHGFPSNIEGFTTTRISKAIAKTNYLFMAFNFSCTPSSDGKFEDKRISQEIQDIKYAINFLEKNYSYKQLVVIGHSTGAINIALYAHKDKRVDKIVLVAGSGDLKQAVKYEFTPMQVRDFWTKGFTKYKRAGKWYHNKKVSKAYYDEFFKLDLLGSLHKFNGPVCIIHPELDEHIPAHKDPKDLYAAATPPKKLVIVKGADHRFSRREHFLKLLYHIDKFIRK